MDRVEHSRKFLKREFLNKTELEIGEIIIL